MILTTYSYFSSFEVLNTFIQQTFFTGTWSLGICSSMPIAIWKYATLGLHELMELMASLWQSMLSLAGIVHRSSCYAVTITEPLLMSGQ